MLWEWVVAIGLSAVWCYALWLISKWIDKRT
jgi:hypothetical protein